MMNTPSKKRRALGGRKPTTNTPPELAHIEEQGTHKWLQGIRSQFNEISGPEDVNVQFLPLQLIYTDPLNPRELEVDKDEIEANIAHLRLPEVAFQNDGEWFEAYSKQVIELFGDTKKAQDILSIARFASDLKGPENLINPISAWREETSFYIFAGERRFLAHVLLETQHIATRIWKHKPSSFDKTILQWQENHSRENLSLWETIRNMEQILDEWSKVFPTSKMTVRKFSQLVSVKRSQAAIYLKVVVSKDTGLMDAMKAGHIKAIEVAHELVCLSDGERKEYLVRIEAGEIITKEIIVAGKKTKAVTVQSNKSLRKVNSVALKLNKKANPQPVAFIVNTVVDKLNKVDLTERINRFDLDNPSELSTALTALLNYIDKEGISDK